MLSIVIPIYIDKESNYHKLILEKYSNDLADNIDKVQIICVISEKDRDSFLDISKIHNINLVTVPHKSSRAERLNKGIDLASKPLVLLNHPRSYVETKGLHYLINNYSELVWGGMTHKFDQNDHFIFKFTSWYSNYIRLKLKGIVYLDHCIFARKNLLEKIGGVPQVDIFEDTLLSQNLKKIVSPSLLPFNSITSAIRFKKNGIFKQSLLNQVIKLCFFMGFSYEKMNKVYEKGLNLNS